MKGCYVMSVGRIEKYLEELSKDTDLKKRIPRRSRSSRPCTRQRIQRKRVI